MCTCQTFGVCNAWCARFRCVGKRRMCSMATCKSWTPMRVRANTSQSCAANEFDSVAGCASLCGECMLGHASPHVLSRSLHHLMSGNTFNVAIWSQWEVHDECFNTKWKFHFMMLWIFFVLKKSVGRRMLRKCFFGKWRSLRFNCHLMCVCFNGKHISSLMFLLLDALQWQCWIFERFQNSNV